MPRSALSRTVHLRLLRARRRWRSLLIHLTLFSGWTWVAAGSLIGFEMLEIVFGAFILAPEFLPLAVLALACVWFIRERIRDRRRRS